MYPGIEGMESILAVPITFLVAGSSGLAVRFLVGGGAFPNNWKLATFHTWRGRCCGYGFFDLEQYSTCTAFSPRAINAYRKPRGSTPKPGII